VVRSRALGNKEYDQMQPVKITPVPGTRVLQITDYSAA